VISGFRGTGKTALINRLLAQRRDDRVAVLSCAGSNPASSAVRCSRATGPVHQWLELDEPWTQASIAHRAASIASSGCFDYLLIEAPASGVPQDVARSLVERRSDGIALSDILRLDTLATVIDATWFLEQFESTLELTDLGFGPAHENQSLVHLLVNQAECADVLILNKSDGVHGRYLRALRALVRQLNPKARRVIAQYGQVDARLLWNAERFQTDGTLYRSFLAEAGESRQRKPDRFGLLSFIYRARRPFHPERFDALMESERFQPILRAKGIVWLATRPAWSGLWSQAGWVSQLGPLGHWAAAIPRDEWPNDPGFREAMLRLWKEPFGDRRQEFVVVCQGADRQEICRLFDECLLTDGEMAAGEDAWAKMADPFPSWELAPILKAPGKEAKKRYSDVE